MYHIIRNSKLLSFCVLFLSLFITQNTFAEELINDDELLEAIANAKPINKGDLIFDIPEINSVLLEDDIKELRTIYLQRHIKLTQQVEDKEFDIGDALITIILPGGLIYAGIKNQELKAAKDDLLHVTTEIKELSNDLIALHTQNSTHTLMLAQIP